MNEETIKQVLVLISNASVSQLKAFEDILYKQRRNLEECETRCFRAIQNSLTNGSV